MNPISAFYLGGTTGLLIGDPKINLPIFPITYTGLSMLYYVKAHSILSQKMIYKRDYSKTFYNDFKSSRVLKTSLGLYALSGIGHYFLAKQY
jgi:hypothetical protein